jgi:citrate lyase subunit beta/citryl-CoA lyase
VILRSALYVPATRPELFAKALASAADAVILDLEDAVAESRKDEGRASVVELLGPGGPGAARGAKPVYVRVNAVGTRHAHADVLAVAALPVAGIRVPKVEGEGHVRTVVGWLEAAGRGAGGAPCELWCLIESAAGLERAFEIASAHPAVASIGLGETDLRVSLRLGHGEEGLAYARGRLVAAARAAGLASPMQSVFTDVKDLERLRASCALGRELGFLGRSCVHPAQLETINAAFTPTEEEAVRAREIVDALAGAEETGAGAVALPDGRFVDLAVVEQARATLALVAAVGTR